MSSETTLPLDWPPLLDECRAWAAGVAVYLGCDTATEDRLCAYRLSVLADLEIGASRDFWARKLAEWVGLDVGATAPSWQPWPGLTWRLLGGNQAAIFADRRLGGVPYRDTHTAPGISTVTGPAAALRLALLSVRP